MAQVSWVKALQEFFTKDGGKKIAIAEFKQLTAKDKADFREMLIAEGYDVAPVEEAAP
jgi:hypothetical protein